MLRRVSVVVPQHPAESLPTADAPERPRGAGHGRDDRVVESLVIPLGMVMREVLHDRTSQGRFAEEDHPVEALGFDRAHESLDPSVGRSRRLHLMATMRIDASGSPTSSIRFLGASLIF